MIFWSKKDIAINFFFHTLSPLLSIIGSVLAARMLDAEGRGILAATINIPLMLCGFATLGLPTVTTILCAKRNANLGRLLGSSSVIQFLSALLFLFLGAFLQTFLLQDMSLPAKIAGYIFLLLIPINLLAGAPLPVLLSQKKMLVYSSVRFIPHLLYVIAILFTYVSPQDPVLTISIIYILLLFFIPLPLTWYMCRVNVKFQLSFSIYDKATLIRMGLPIMFANIPALLNQKIDQIIIATVLNNSELGIYATAVGISSFLLPISAAFGTLILPELSRNAFSFKKVLIKYLFAGIALYALLITVFLSFANVIILNLLGKSFLPIIDILYILMPAGAVLALNQILVEAIRAIHKAYIQIYTEIAVLIIAVMGLFIFLPIFGIAAAAWTSLVSYTFCFVCLTVFSFFVVKQDDLKLIENNRQE